MGRSCYIPAWNRAVRQPEIFCNLANGESSVAMVLFLHGWNSKPGGVKPSYLAEHGHTVINPALPDEDFAESVRIARPRSTSTTPMWWSARRAAVQSP